MFQEIEEIHRFRRNPRVLHTVLAAATCADIIEGNYVSIALDGGGVPPRAARHKHAKLHLHADLGTVAGVVCGTMVVLVSFFLCSLSRLLRQIISLIPTINRMSNKPHQCLDLCCNSNFREYHTCNFPSDPITTEGCRHHLWAL